MFTIQAGDNLSYSEGPSGGTPWSIQINNGDVNTDNNTLNLSLKAADKCGIKSYCISRSASDCTSDGWIEVTPSKNLDITTQYNVAVNDFGNIGLNLKVRNILGHQSTVGGDSIQYLQADSLPPSNPSISINSGASSTDNLTVSLSLSASDNVGVTAYYLSESSSTPTAQSQGWVEVSASTGYSADVGYTLADDTGGSTERTVYVWFKDAQGNLSQGAFDSIYSSKAILQLASGENFSCARLVNNTVRCWGAGGSGQLGNGTLENRARPVEVTGLTNVLQISAGAEHACALLHDGAIKCWGEGDYGRLGDGTASDRSTPVSVQGISSAVSVSAGFRHSCALLDDATVKCWGIASHGELGYGQQSSSHIPVLVPNLEKVVSVVAGYEQSCALHNDGTVSCWGNINQSVTTPSKVSHLSDAVAIRAGQHFLCALRSDNSVSCWGEGSFGRLGTDSNSSLGSPIVPVSGINNAVDITTGFKHGCALLSDSSLRCWGSNDQGRLGDGTTSQRFSPVAVDGINNAQAVVAGTNHTCALLTDQTLKCWGKGSSGQIGSESLPQVQKTPLQVPWFPPGPADTESPSGTVTVLNKKNYYKTSTQASIEIDASDNNSLVGYCVTGQSTTPVMGDVCWKSILPVQNLKLTSTVKIRPRSDTQTVYAWFRDASANLSNRAEDNFSFKEVPLKLSAGGRHVCAWDSQTVACWGSGYNGMLGNGSTSDSSTPVMSRGLEQVTQIASGESHSCAVLDNGTMRCWGKGLNGRLGNGSYEDSSLPVAVRGITSATQVSAGSMHTCARLSDSSVRCWGRGTEKQLGNGESTDSALPVNVSGISTALKVESGYKHNCALLEGGFVQCWGYDSSGALGSELSYAETPITVSNISSAIDLSAGYSHNCALLNDGTIKCWGRGNSGQLGDGKNQNSSTPVTVSGIDDAVHVGAGENYSCAILSGGTVKCWGLGAFFRLGNGKNESSSTPVTVSGISNAVALAVGNNFSCATLEDGAVQCWGLGDFGQLGTGGTGSSSSPVDVIGISSFSLDAFVPPLLAEVTPISSPVNDSTPNYTFSSTEAGTISYSGACASSHTGASSGNNTITLNELDDGTFNDCTVKVTDSDGNASNSLSLTAFTVAAPPSGSIQLNEGASTTLVAEVNVSLIASDNQQVVAYLISESGTTPSNGDSRWNAVSPAKNFSDNISHSFNQQTTIGNYGKTLYAWFKDAANHVSDAVQASITYVVNSNRFDEASWDNLVFGE